MTEAWFNDAEQDGVHLAAAEWLVRLQDPHLSVDDTISWQSWMSADERHAHAFRRIEETWQRFHGLYRPALIGSEALAADRYDGSMPVSRWLTPASQWVTSPRRLLAPGTLALAASVALVTIGALLALHSARPLAFADGTFIETGIGENRSVRLADGSTVELGGHTRVEVALDAESRRLSLVRGEAYFAVARDAARPFSVHAGAATVTALGTEFNVRRADDRVVVAVVEGRVLINPRVPLAQKLHLVREAAAQKRRPLHLQAGSQSIVDDAGLESAGRLADSSSAVAWQTGRLDFDREPLRYALESVNRYAAKPIELDDASMGDLRITGAALNDNIGGWVASLESAFGLTAVEAPDRIVLKRARPLD